MATLTPTEKKAYLDLAQQAALLAGKEQMLHFGLTTVKIRTKTSSNDLVTSVDESCDAIISNHLKSHCPNHRFLTEETYQESDPILLDNTWVIDPIDGTTNYAHGFPHFAVSIAYFHEGQAEVGVIYDPFKKEMFTAIRDRGAFLNDVQIFVSQTQSLSHALLATGFPYDLATNQTNNISYFQRVLPHCHGVRRPGSAALDLAYLAAGRLDGFWELRLAPWDIAAGVLLIQEAGGRVTDFAQNPLNLAQRRLDLVGSNDSAIHHELQALLQGS